MTYYATSTAYNGRVTLPQLLETRDFRHFRVLTLNGREVIIPYAMSDKATLISAVPLDALLAALLSNPPAKS